MELAVSIQWHRFLDADLNSHHRYVLLVLASMFSSLTWRLYTAPSFFSAGIYFILGKLIRLLGPQYSALSWKMYLYIFCSCDILSLTIQAIGGGMASEANNTVGGDTAPGTHIMVAGIVFQLASMTLFVGFFIDFLRKARAGPPEKRVMIRRTVAAMFFSVVLIYIRSIYRTIELSEGWAGYLITHESYFIGLDGSMMIAAVAVFNLVHPGWELRPKKGAELEMDVRDEGLTDEETKEVHEPSASSAQLV